MKLLISPKNESEATEAIAGGAHIIDVKNPAEGALGANYPWTIKKIRHLTPKDVEVSCTLGDAPNLPGSFALAAYGAASLGVDYVKVGVYGPKTVEEAVYFVAQIVKAAKSAAPRVKVAAAGYADANKIGALNPLLIPQITSKAGADVAMIDTATKNGKTLFDHFTHTQLKTFIDAAHGYGLRAALAGSLRKQDLATVYYLGADLAGFRGAVCTNSDRNGGKVTRELVAEIVDSLKQLENTLKRQ